MKKYDAVIAGYTCVDMIPDFKRIQSVTNLSDLFIPGKLIEIDGMSFVLGGVVPNTGLAMKKFGMDVFLNGLVGDDLLGEIAREWLDKYNLSEGMQTSGKSGTAFSIVIAPPGIDRIFLESPGCNQIFDTEFINFEAVSQSRLFHFGYPPLLKQFYRDNGSQLRDLFSRIQDMGVVTSLDFSLPDPDSESGQLDWPKIMKSVLPFTDIFVPSLEEALQIMFENGDILDHISIDLIRILGKHIIESGVKILLIKMAHRGVYLITGDVSSINEKSGVNLPEENWNFRELWCEAYPADESRIINATGAGDTAVAAFLSAILEGQTVESSLKYAALAGRNNLYCNNIYEELPGWPEMAEEIKICHNEVIRLDGQPSENLDNIIKFHFLKTAQL